MFFCKAFKLDSKFGSKAYYGDQNSDFHAMGYCFHAIAVNRVKKTN